MTGTVAIMQPYFVPYAGYFRLYAASDLFVVYDCVQFPRRGWVHRNRLVDRTGALRWLTLPLAKAPRDILIRDLRFTSDADAVVAERLRRFELAPADQDARGVIDTVRRIEGTPADYILRTLDCITSHLRLSRETIRSSALDIAPSVRGQDRILEIVRRVGAKRYINAPGGRSLYDAEVFDCAGIRLEFLPEYAGPSVSILSRIVAESGDELAREIRASI